MVEINYKDSAVSIPGVLEELSASEYLDFLLFSTLYNKSHMDISTFYVKLMSKLLGQNVDYTHYTPNIIYQLDSQLDKLNGFFKDVDLENGDVLKVPILSTGKNMLQSYCGWVGPDDMLNGIHFGIFCQCLELLKESEIAVTKDAPARLDEIYTEITGLLYKTPTDEAKMPYLLIIHAITFFTNVWNLILTTPITIRGGEIDFNILFKSSGKKTTADDHTGWAGIAMEAATAGLFGTLKEVNDTPMWDVLLYLYKCKFEYLQSSTK